MKYIKNILLTLALAGTLSSCVSEIDDVFDKSSNERINEALASNKDVLVNQPNGWLLQMYGNFDFGGYNVMMKFSNDNNVTVATERNYEKGSKTKPYEAITSHYKLEQSSGVVLSFDEYNKNIHYFSDPHNDDFGVDGRGFEADHEYRILSASADSVVLLGKKHSNRLKLVPAPVAESGWQNYFDQVQEVENNMSCFYYNLKAGDKSYDVTFNTGSRLLSVAVPVDDGFNYVKVPYTVTNEGFDFYEPLELNGKSITGFKNANADNFKEKSNSDVELQCIIYPLYDLLTKGTYYFSYSNLSPAAAPYWYYMYNTCLTKEHETISYMYMGICSTGRFGLQFKSGNYIGRWYFDTEKISDNEISLKLKSYDNNGKYYYNNAGGNYVCYTLGSTSGATFKLSTDNMKMPTYIRMENKNNPEMWMIMSPSSITNPFSK